jgi:hypothetical protein
MRFQQNSAGAGHFRTVLEIAYQQASVKVFRTSVCMIAPMRSTVTKEDVVTQERLQFFVIMDVTPCKDVE